MALSAVVTWTELQTLFATHGDDIISATTIGAREHTRRIDVPSLTAALALSSRTYAFTPRVDEEIGMIFARGTADAINRTMTATLAVDNGDDRYLVENAVAIAVTSSGAAAFDTRDEGGHYSNKAGVRARLIGGVRYRLTIETDAGTWTDAVLLLHTRTRRLRR